MCILIVLRGFHADHPLVVAANRDERTDRASAPPGLFVGRQRRMLSPRDKVAGGTWLAIDDGGRFAGITNLAGFPPVPDAPSRGLLPHVALDEPSLEAGVAAVERRVAEHAHSAFQLVVADARHTIVLRHVHGVLRRVDWEPQVLVVTNEHGPGELEPRGLPRAIVAGLDLGVRLDLLAGVLADRGGDGWHAITKRGEGYGTVSSSLVALPAGDPTKLVWRFAPGPPDTTAYRNYGNLGRRLLPEEMLP